MSRKSVLLWIACAAVAYAQAPDARQALERLRAGNLRYVAGEYDVSRMGPAARAALTSGQHPFATVLTCSDSRVPPEAIFGQGLGDLFVSRVAGAVPDQAVLGSIEYAAEHLQVPLVVVMGHIACGAVKSAMESSPPRVPDAEHANLERILSAIRPSLIDLPAKGDRWENAVYASVTRNLSETLRLSPVLREFSSTGKVQVVGAVYDLRTGEVEFLKPNALRPSLVPLP
jgi:carbonic anhydrase